MADAESIRVHYSPLVGHQEVEVITIREVMHGEAVTAVGGTVGGVFVSTLVAEAIKSGFALEGGAALVAGAGTKLVFAYLFNEGGKRIAAVKEWKELGKGLLFMAVGSLASIVLDVIDFVFPEAAARMGVAVGMGIREAVVGPPVASSLAEKGVVPPSQELKSAVVEGGFKHYGFSSQQSQETPEPITETPAETPTSAPPETQIQTVRRFRYYGFEEKK